MSLGLLETELAGKVADLFSSLLLALLKLIPYPIRKAIRRYVEIRLSRLTQHRFGLRPTATFFPTSMRDVEELVTIDGIRLKTTHMFPHEDENEIGQHKPLPVAILRTPYFRRFDTPIGRVLCERGFHVLMQDTRGRFESEGAANLGERERNDAGCTLRWLSQQEWFDGRVFFLGISIGGYTTWASAAAVLQKHHLGSDQQQQQKHITVSAIFPLFSSSDILRRGLFHNHLSVAPYQRDPIVRLDLASRYAAFMHSLSKRKRILGSPLAFVAKTAATWQISSQFNMWKQRQKALPLGDLDLAAIGPEEIPDTRLPLHVEKDHSFWSMVSLDWAPPRAAVEPMSDDPLHTTPPAIMFATGWYDIFLTQTVEDFHSAITASDASSQPNSRLYLLIGPWTHFSAETFFPPVMREILRVLDTVFADLGRSKHHHDDLDSKPRVTVYCLGAGGLFPHRHSLIQRFLTRSSKIRFDVTDFDHFGWRHYDSWPPKTSQPCVLYLGPRGSCCSHQPVSMTGVAGYDSLHWNPLDPVPQIGGPTFDFFGAGCVDNRMVESRLDTLVYTTAQSSKMFEIAGKVTCKVKLWSNAVSADVYARLCLVDGETGESLPVCEGISRCTLRPELGEAWPRMVEVDLGWTCAQIGVGWCLRVMLAGGSFPQFGRNLGYGDDIATATRMKSAVHTVEWGGASCLIIPVVGGDVGWRGCFL